MKKILSRSGWLAVAAALTMGFTACSGSDDIATGEPANPTEPKTYTMTVQASKGDNATTRALSYNDGTKKLSATWTKGDKVAVYGFGSGSYVYHGTLTAQSTGAETTLTGTLTSAPSRDNDIWLISPTETPWDYTGQRGTLADISQNLDCAVCKIATNKWSVSGMVITVDGTAEFTNPQAIVRFTLMNKDNNSAIPVKTLTLHDSNGNLYQIVKLTDEGSVTGDLTITLDQASSQGEVWAAIYVPKGETRNFKLTLTATDKDANIYTYEMNSGKSFAAGTFYPVTVMMSEVAGQSGTGGNGSEISGGITPVGGTTVKVGINAAKEASMMGLSGKFYYQIIDSDNLVIAE